MAEPMITIGSVRLTPDERIQLEKLRNYNESINSTIRRLVVEAAAREVKK